jgi:hypothetical protein
MALAAFGAISCAGHDGAEGSASSAAPAETATAVAGPGSFSLAGTF